MKQRSACLALATIALLPASLAAQFLPTPPKVLAVPSSTRAMALGGAYMTDSGHADAIFYHPALLAGATGFGLEVQRWGGEGSATAASAAMAWLGGGIGIGLQTLQAGLGGRFVDPDQDDLLVHGDVPLSERVATLGYARRVFGIRVGASGKLVEERLDGASSTTVLVDVGVATDVGPFTVGLTAQDYGSDPFEVDGGLNPARLVLGAGAYGQPVGPFDVGIAGALTHTADRTWVGGGVEVAYWPVSGRTFVARVGLQDTPEGTAADPLTFGFAFWGDDLVLEWAYRGFGDLDDATHRFGVRWR